MIPVILSGGSGTRLWPLSRTQYPKQYLKLNSALTMLQETCGRLDGLDYDTLMVVANEEHRFLVAEQLRQQNHPARILLEPAGRNTAPAVALAALWARHNGWGDQVLLVLSADHVIGNAEAFRSAVGRAEKAAQSGQLVTFGVVPDHPETGYGYIATALDISRGAADAVAVKEFVEKPDLKTAQRYLDSGQYLWNSGMFMFRADDYLDELKQYRPEIYDACVEAQESWAADRDFIRPGEEAFLRCPDESIDYAIMENTRNAAVVPLDANWSDVGSWSALFDVTSKTQEGNVLQGDVVVQDVTESFLQSEDRLVAAIGVDNLVVVDTKDALLVADKSRVQDVKGIVERLKADNRPEVVHHREVFRPWGKYDSIDQGGRYQVKHITVNPGEKLSLQKHHHRAEHWIVVSGTAKVTRGEESFLISENQSTYIPVGEVHALENPGRIPLEVIEVQSGSYLGEDDIVRLEDRYDRLGED